MRDQLAMTQETIETLNTAVSNLFRDKKMIKRRCEALQMELTESKGIKFSTTFLTFPQPRRVNCLKKLHLSKNLQQHLLLRWIYSQPKKSSLKHLAKICKMNFMQPWLRRRHFNRDAKSYSSKSFSLKVLKYSSFFILVVDSKQQMDYLTLQIQIGQKFVEELNGVVVQHKGNVNDSKCVETPSYIKQRTWHLLWRLSTNGKQLPKCLQSRTTTNTICWKKQKRSAVRLMLSNGSLKSPKMNLANSKMSWSHP